MEVHDLVNGASATLEWSAFHSTRFVGTPQAGTTGGLFTGLMTEQYQTSSYYGDEQRVKYELSGSPLSSAWMGFNEWVPANHKSVFWQASRVNFTGPSDSQSISHFGAFETSSAQEFVTGSLDSGPTCAPILPFWESYKYPIFGIGAATAVIAGALVIRRRNRTKAPDQKNDSLTAPSFPRLPTERPPQPPP